MFVDIVFVFYKFDTGTLVKLLAYEQNSIVKGYVCIDYVKEKNPKQ